MDDFTANLLFLLAVLASPAVAAWLAIGLGPQIDRLVAWLARPADGEERK